MARRTQQRRRRILYIDLAPTVGGSVISLYELLRGLDRERFDPWVLLGAQHAYAAKFRELGLSVTALDQSNAASPDPTSQAWSGVRHSRLAASLKRVAVGEDVVHAVGFYLRIWPGLRRQARQVAQIIRTIDPDLVHLNDAVCVSRVGILAALLTKKPAICHLRSMDSRNHYDRWLSRSLRGYICISQAVDDHQRHLGGRVAPSWIIHNGLDLAEFDRAASGEAMRPSLGLSAQDVVVACIGRLVSWKGQHVFLRALAELAPRYPRLRGVIIGAPEANSQAYADELRSLTRELGLESIVSFTGFRQDIPRLLRGADILVHASIQPEPFGRVLIEGMAASAAVIGTASGAVPEIIEDGVTGLLIAPADPKAMARAIAWLLDHPERAAALRGAGRRAVEERFSIHQYVRAVECVYEKVLP
jgi:glycosyltransferase involved in cell wall biosynthesis